MTERIINVEPDGLLSAAYNVVDAMQQNGMFVVEMYTDENGDMRFRDEAMTTGEAMVFIFQQLALNAELIDKSSWLPHNK